MVIYDIEKLDDNVHIQKKTPNPQIYTLCEMGAELEGVVDGIIGETGTVGSDTKPIKLVEGVATPVTNDLVDTKTAQEIRGAKTFASSGFTTIAIKSDRTTPTQNIGGIGFYDGDGNGKSGIDVKVDGRMRIDFSNADTKALIIPEQRSYQAGNTEDVVTIGTLAGNPEVVHTTGNETISGSKKFNSQITKVADVTGNTAPDSYKTGSVFNTIGTDDGKVFDVEWEKGTTDVNRAVLRIFGNINTSTNTKCRAEIHFIFDEINGEIKLQSAYVDKTGTKSWSQAQVLQSWTVE